MVELAALTQKHGIAVGGLAHLYPVEGNDRGRYVADPRREDHFNYVEDGDAPSGA